MQSHLLTCERWVEKLEPIVCPACNLVNPPGEDYCRECMEPLTPEAIAEEESVQRFVMKNFSTLRKYLDKVEREQIQTAQGMKNEN